MAEGQWPKDKVTLNKTNTLYIFCPICPWRASRVWLSLSWTCIQLGLGPTDGDEVYMGPASCPSQGAYKDDITVYLCFLKATPTLEA